MVHSAAAANPLMRGGTNLHRKMKMQSNKQDIQSLVSTQLPTQTTTPIGNASSDSFLSPDALKAAPRQPEISPEIIESQEHLFRAFIADRLSRRKAPQSLLHKIRRSME
jgi:hypothetical protein